MSPPGKDNSEDIDIDADRHESEGIDGEIHSEAQDHLIEEEELESDNESETSLDEVPEIDSELDQDDPSESSPHHLNESPETAALELPVRTSPPAGLRRANGNGLDLVDAMAGRAGVYGFDRAVTDAAWQSLDEAYLGDGSAYEPTVDESQNLHDALHDALLKLAGEDIGCRASRVFCVPSPAEAIEWAVAAVRNDQEFRTLTLAGSDHGRTAVGRTASGLADLQSGYGPLVAGFTHVRTDDVDSIRTAIDDQTTALLLSPIHLDASGQPVEPELLIAAREICDANDLSLMIDQTQWTFGGGGTALAHRSLADIDADIVLCSAGIFGGIPGAMVIANDKFDDITVPSHPFHCALATTTLAAMQEDDLIAKGSERINALAIALAEIVTEFDFVRDLHVAGSSLGIECDIESSSLVDLASASGLRLEAAGDTSVRMQLPLHVSNDDWDVLTQRLQHILTGMASRQAAIA